MDSKHVVETCVRIYILPANAYMFRFVYMIYIVEHVYIHQCSRSMTMLSFLVRKRGAGGRAEDRSHAAAEPPAAELCKAPEAGPRRRGVRGGQGNGVT